MTDQLIEKAFEKAGIESGKDSVNGKAEHLSEYLLMEFKFSVSTKSLTRYFKKESTPNQQVKKYLAQFLDFENYEDFVLKNSPGFAVKTNPGPLKKKETNFKRVALFSLLILSVTGISAYVGFKNGEEKCMIWEDDHYIEISCTGSNEEQKLNPYLLENLRKIQISDTTSFFKNGAAQVWYDKSDNRLEYFTAPGIHPQNGKTLKPVTSYIIDKYLRN